MAVEISSVRRSAENMHRLGESGNSMGTSLNLIKRREDPYVGRLSARTVVEEEDLYICLV
jgi:hypothetical protein